MRDRSTCHRPFDPTRLECPPRAGRLGPGVGLATLLAAVTLVAAPTIATGQDCADEPTAAVARIIAADNAGDLEAVVSLYTEHAVLLPPGGAPIEGREAIREHYTGLFAGTRVELDFRCDESRVAGDWAFNRGVTLGRAFPKDGGAAARIDDKYLMVLHHDPDGWRIARLIWNSNPRQ